MATRKTSRKKPARKNRPTPKKGSARGRAAPKYPRHSPRRALRIPKAILDQNAGRPCNDKDAAEFLGVGYTGDFKVEISSGIKYGFLERPEAGKIVVTGLAKSVLRPQEPKDELDGLRKAVLRAPDISQVYSHYRGENLPDDKFFQNAVVDKFKIPQDKVAEFGSIFLESLGDAQLIEEHEGKKRVLDVSQESAGQAASTDTLRRLGRAVHIEEGDSCFVMMPFANPIGGYYASVYEPAIRKAGLKPVRADADIFATGKIMDQVWSGINAAKVLVCELTHRNPNVYYELGLAHALEKPVVLVSSNEEDVPFDLQHIRVIYYDVTDPFWGEKLISKVAENILSALNNPEEAIFKRALD